MMTLGKSKENSEIFRNSAEKELRDLLYSPQDSGQL